MFYIKSNVLFYFATIWWLFYHCNNTNRLIVLYKIWCFILHLTINFTVSWVTSNILYNKLEKCFPVSRFWCYIIYLYNYHNKLDKYFPVSRFWCYIIYLSHICTVNLLSNSIMHKLLLTDSMITFISNIQGLTKSAGWQFHIQCHTW